MFNRIMQALAMVASAAVWSVSPGVVSSTASAAVGDSFIIVANGTYKNAPPIEFADRDAAAVEKAAVDVLKVQRSGMRRIPNMTYSDSTFWFRPDGSAGPDLLKFVKGAANGGTDATIYFYFTGHGITVKDEFHLVLADTKTDDIGATSVSISTVQNALGAAQREIVPGGKVVLLVDACFSGNARDGNPIWPGAKYLSPEAFQKEVPPRLLMLGASSNEMAWSDPTRQYSVFTDALVDGLYGRAAGSDGRITALGLHEFIQKRVGERLPSGKTQTPMIRGDAATKIATLTTLSRPYPVRDPSVEPQCTAMKTTPDDNEVADFLDKSCLDEVSCSCRGELLKRVDQKRRCDVELSMISVVIAKGRIRKQQVSTMLTDLKCAVSVRKANEALKIWADEEKSEAAVKAPTPPVTTPPVVNHLRPDWCTQQAQLSIAERTVCQDARLAGLDIKLNQLFQNLSPPQKLQIRADQKAWAAQRESCASDVNCLFSLYQKHFPFLTNASRWQPGTAASTPPVEASFWTHNGSTMRLTINGSKHRMTYELPTEFIIASGGGPGTVLFDVVITNDTYQGVAYTVRQMCSPRSYAIKGSISSDRNRIELSGLNPATDAQCGVTGTKIDKMVFERVTASTGVTAAGTLKAPQPAAPTSNGATFKLFPNSFFEKADLRKNRRDQPTANDCERLCAQMPNCAKYEFYVVNPAKVAEDRADPDRRPKCSLSANKFDIKPNSGGESGTRVGVRN